MPQILVTGSIAYDLLLQSDGSFADALQGASVEHLSIAFLAPHFRRHHGGTGANIAWNLRLLGASPLLVSTVGHDGGPYTALLQERGVAIDHVEVLAMHATATAIIATDSGERQITFFHPGADSEGIWPDLSDERDDLAWAIVSPRAVTVMMRALEWCHAAHIPVLFDPGQQMQGFSDDALRHALQIASGVVVNAYEAEMLGSRLHLSEKALAQAVPLLIITRGEQGCSVFEQGKRSDIGACKADAVVNPTGAGDAFRAGLLVGLSSGWSLTDAARMGASVGSFVVEIEGTLLERLDMDEVRMRAEEAYSEKLPKLAS